MTEEVTLMASHIKEKCSIEMCFLPKAILVVRICSLIARDSLTMMSNVFVWVVEQAHHGRIRN